MLSTLPVTFTAALFVGGESRRMGADKATLMVGGKTLWSRQLESLQGVCPDQLLISARFKPEWSPGNIEIVLDEPESVGPLNGLRAALRRTETTHLLALAIDLPRMTSEHLLKLMQVSSPGCGVVPQCGELYEPLCAIYPSSALPFVERALAEGRYSLQSLVNILVQQNSMKIFHVIENEQILYSNLNSPEDLRTITEKW